MQNQPFGQERSFLAMAVITFVTTTDIICPCVCSFCDIMVTGAKIFSVLGIVEFSSFEKKGNRFANPFWRASSTLVAATGFMDDDNDDQHRKEHQYRNDQHHHHQNDNNKTIDRPSQYGHV